MGSFEFACMHSARSVVAALDEVIGIEDMRECVLLENIAREAAMHIGRMCGNNAPSIWYEHARGKGSVKIAGELPDGAVVTAEVKITVSA